jgi:GT2 family glycosyltransferase
LARLQNYAASKPLLIAEAGADVVTQGDEYQAEMLRFSIDSSLELGCCGFVAYTFCDGWWSGKKVIDWKMGIMTEDRQPRIAYYSVQNEFKDKKLNEEHLPTISVVVATYNGAHYIYKCLNALMLQNYPKDKFEIIVVVDGSTDKTVEYVKKYPVRMIELKENGGLSHARNVGAAASQSEIIAYTDDDCEPDNDWLYYIAKAFDSDRVGAVGGPNITPVDDSFMAKCTSQAPGAPTHVLIDDRKADHVPGCNLAIRKYVMDAIGGFDEIFRIAGDDVDIEWRIQKAGYIVRFTPAAYVFHHRRDKIKTYIKQQYNYGISEAFVRHRHEERFQGFSAIWRGFIYNTYNNSANNLISLFKKPIIYFGWFPLIYKPEPNYFYQLPLDIRWHLVWIMFLLFGIFSKIVLFFGLLMFLISLVTCALIAEITVNRKHVNGDHEIKEFFVITYLSFLWSFVRRYGQFKGELYIKKGYDTRGRMK